MNKRQEKKKAKKLSLFEEVGYSMSYREKRMIDRGYHDYCIQNQHHMKSKAWFEELNEFREMLGIYDEPIIYIPCYPNRMRWKTIRKREGR